ncbi:hypothetical protein [uncultured Fibrella sp.]|uniref:hypothetical protein n=1 Tax=uncultured Fibrella sp. TaxID=1284596 RepID=UPI0035CB44DC
MTDDEISQAILNELHERYNDSMRLPLHIYDFARGQLGVLLDGRLDLIIDQLQLDGLIQNLGTTGGHSGLDYKLTMKGLRLVTQGSWSSYKAEKEAAIRKVEKEAYLASRKLEWEVNYLWIGIAGLLVAVLTVGWTIYHDLSDDKPTRQEFNLLKAKVDSLQGKQQKITLPIPSR